MAQVSPLDGLDYPSSSSSSSGPTVISYPQCGPPLATGPSRPTTADGTALLPSPRPLLSVPSSIQRMSRMHSTAAEAIANFRPTSRDVISGIAPHVFDERKRRRSQKRVSRHQWYDMDGRKKRSSPLRGATVFSWDEHSIYLEQPDSRCASVEKLDPCLRRENVEDSHSRTRIEPAKSVNVATPRSTKLNKSRWNHFRVDTHLLKSIIVKLKPRL